MAPNHLTLLPPSGDHHPGAGNLAAASPEQFGLLLCGAPSSQRTTKLSFVQSRLFGCRQVLGKGSAKIIACLWRTHKFCNKVEYGSLERLVA